MAGRKMKMSFDPFREACGLERGFGGEREFFGMPWKRLWHPFAAAMRSPVLDVFDAGKEVVVTAELPGVKKEDLKLRVTEGGISLKVKEKEERKEEREGFYSYSSRFEGFSQFVSLPARVDAARAQATFKNGVLEVRIPKKGGAAAGEGKELKIS